MKKLIFILSVVTFIFMKNALGQNRSNIWMIGYNYGTFPDAALDFSNGFADTFSVDRPTGFFWTDATICDTTGELLFYTNGIVIGNRIHDTLLNSVNYNPGWLTSYYDDGEDGLGIAQGSIILPCPDHSALYYLFSESAEIINNNGFTDIQPLNLRYSVIDMSLDVGYGGIISGKKTLVALEDTLLEGRIAACKHANGRDWWVICHEYYTDKYYKLLATPDTVMLIGEQQIGSTVHDYDPNGTAVFSPDGSKFAMIGVRDTLDIFDFDRCTGEFNNPVMVIVPDSVVSKSCAFSYSGRFLYASTLNHIFQYEVTASDIPNSVIDVALYDTSTIGLARWFSAMQLGPDGRIYISTFNATLYMHYIDQPDSLGLSCNVIQSGIVLPSYSFNSVPNNPNYDLGPLEGSPCDTLFNSSISVATESEFKILSNPVTDWLNIVYRTKEDALLELFDLYGKRVAAISLFHYFKNRLLNVSALPAGVYLAAATQNGKRIWSEKVIVSR